MIFDAHAHIYPDAIALKAAHSIAEFYDIPVLCDGTLGTLLEIGAKNDITRFLVHSVAMSPKRTRHIDDYIAQCVREHPDKLVGFGTLHPIARILRQTSITRSPWASRASKSTRICSYSPSTSRARSKCSRLWRAVCPC